MFLIFLSFLFGLLLMKSPARAQEQQFKLVNTESVTHSLLPPNAGFSIFVSLPLLDSSLSKVSPCSEAGKPCNPCLDAAKACNLNETCKRLRSAYNSICSKATPPQPSLANQEPCSRKRCQKVRTICSNIITYIYVFMNVFICFWNILDFAIWQNTVWLCSEATFLYPSLCKNCIFFFIYFMSLYTSLSTRQKEKVCLSHCFLCRSKRVMHLRSTASNLSKHVEFIKT